MKNIIYLLACLFVISCKAQNGDINAEKKDVLVFSFMNGNVKLIDDSSNQTVSNQTGLVVFLQKWRQMGSNYGNKTYNFKKENDTMTITCSCGQEKNLFIKNLEFKKGKFQLNIFNDDYKSRTEIFSKNKIGYELNINSKVKNILFKKAFVKISANPYEVFEDTYFKNLKFVELDVKYNSGIKIIKSE